MKSQSLLAPLVNKLSRHSPLNEEHAAAIEALPHSGRSFDPGACLVREGDPVQSCCLMISGFAYRHKIAGNGGRQILAIHMAGETVDLQNALLDVADHHVQALTRVECAYISRKALIDLAFAVPAIGQALWKDTLIDAAISREWVVNVGRRDSRTRIAHLLCEIAVRQQAAGLGERNRYELPLTQEQLADAAGLTPVHVNRVLQSLGAARLIQRDKRSITIEDWDEMMRVGDFSTRYLHGDDTKGELA